MSAGKLASVRSSRGSIIVLRKYNERIALKDAKFIYNLRVNASVLIHAWNYSNLLAPTAKVGCIFFTSSKWYIYGQPTLPNIILFLLECAVKNRVNKQIETIYYVILITQSRHKAKDARNRSVSFKSRTNASQYDVGCPKRMHVRCKSISWTWCITFITKSTCLIII